MLKQNKERERDFNQLQQTTILNLKKIFCFVFHNFSNNICNLYCKQSILKWSKNVWSYHFIVLTNMWSHIYFLLENSLDNNISVWNRSWDIVWSKDLLTVFDFHTFENSFKFFSVFLKFYLFWICFTFHGHNFASTTLQAISNETELEKKVWRKFFFSKVFFPSFFSADATSTPTCTSCFL